MKMFISIQAIIRFSVDSKAVISCSAMKDFSSEATSPAIITADLLAEREVNEIHFELLKNIY